MSDEQKRECGACRYWVPAYYGVGRCCGEGMPNAKFWVQAAEPRGLLTHITFHCAGFTDKEEIPRDIL